MVPQLFHIDYVAFDILVHLEINKQKKSDLEILPDKKSRAPLLSFYKRSQDIILKSCNLLAYNAHYSKIELMIRSRFGHDST